MGWRGVSICIFFAALVTVSQQTVSECPERWTERTAAGKCSKSSDQAMTYEDAKKTCEDFGATLPIANDMAQAVLFSEMFAVNAFWLGLTDIASEGDWTWDDGTKAEHFRWNPYEATVNTAENCVVLTTKTHGLWSDVSCSSKQFFHCMIELESKSTFCPPGFEYDDAERCIFMSPTKITHSEAKITCNDLGATLPMPRDGDEGVLLHIKMNTYFWLGMTDETSEGVWMWDDGTSVEKTRWYSTEPNGLTNENCGAMHNTYGAVWMDLPCTNYETLMCIKTVVPPTDTWAECREGWRTVGPTGKCIHEYENIETYDTAKLLCEYLGGSLPISKTSGDSDIWREHYSDYSFWMGLTDLKFDNGTWEWDDGIPAENRPNRWWKIGDVPYEPKTAVGYNCAIPMVGLNPDWTASKCTDLMRFICERDIQETTTEPVTTTSKPEPVTEGEPAVCEEEKEAGTLETLCQTPQGQKLCAETCEEYATTTAEPDEATTDLKPDVCQKQKKAGTFEEFCETSRGQKLCAKSCEEYETTTEPDESEEDKDPGLCAQKKEKGKLVEFCGTRRGFRKCRKSCRDYLVDLDPEMCANKLRQGILGEYCRKYDGKKKCAASCYALKYGPLVDANPDFCQEAKDDGKFNKYFCKKRGKKLCKLSCKELQSQPEELHDKKPEQCKEKVASGAIKKFCNRKTGARRCKKTCAQLKR